MPHGRARARWFRGGHEEQYDHYAQARGDPLVGARACLDASQVEEREQYGKEHRPGSEGHCRDEVHRSLAAPDHADDRVQDIIENHGPSREVAKRWVQFPADVGVGRTRAGIGPGHSPVADRREQHGNHADQDGRDHMPLCLLADNAVQGHGGGRLDQDDSVEDQLLQAQDLVQARCWHAQVSRKQYGRWLDPRGHEVT